MAKWPDTTPEPERGVPRRRSRRKADPSAFPTLEPFARRLENLRLERGFTQRALAERAGISANHYQDIAHAQANPSVIVLLSLADALGVPVVDLFESSTPPPADHRLVFVADLKELAASHRRLTDIVKRLAKAKTWPKPRHAKRLPRA